ncbi:hypothetical protein [Pantanalinema sp. GBBB05]|uniref:hypothetical protein n=1 Tax=Pantanalinema sp. GBBB05 TaxID=2604139 RepID=UPI001DD47087|nr:hypothetical protein [Pantanalinema sp. GBBB05]
MSQESLISNNPLENEELSEEELDAVAGGQTLPSFSSESLQTDDSGILKTTDNMFTSFDGAKGTSQAVQNGVHKPLNMSLSFP